jgi:hypothetical protein
MIYADASKISEAIVGDPALLRALHGFVEKVTGDADLGALLDDVAAFVAARSPFPDHASLAETVRCEMLQALHALALDRLPTKGNA